MRQKPRNINEIAPCKVIQDSLVFWIPRYELLIFRTHCLWKLRIELNSGFQSIGFRIPQSKNSRIPESKSKNYQFRNPDSVKCQWSPPHNSWKETTDPSDDNQDFLTGGERKDNFSSHLYWLRNTGMQEATLSLTNPAAWSVNESHGCRRTLNSGYLKLDFKT